VTKNIGQLSNKGMELSIKTQIIQKRNIGWNLNFNISGNRNKILSIHSSFTIGVRNDLIYKPGIPMFSFYANKQLGVNPKNGNIIFKDVNGDGVFEPSEDKTIVGQATPKFRGGITNDISYKDFDLSFFFNFKYGNTEFNANRFFAEGGGTRAQSFIYTQLRRWQKPGDKTMIPKMTQENYPPGAVPSRFFEDGSYIRLRDLTLRYSLSSKIAKNLGVESASIYVKGRNLFTITNYIGTDPEITSFSSNPLIKGTEFLSVPHPKSYSIGINIIF
jgi:hypothetical protein